MGFRLTPSNPNRIIVFCGPLERNTFFSTLFSLEVTLWYWTSWGLFLCTCRRSLALLSLLNEEGEELCLHELLHKSAVGLGGQSLTEGPFLEVSLPIGFPLDVGSVVTYSLDKELNKRP